MRTVWKANLEYAEKLKIMVPKGANVLDIQVRHGVPTIWFEVDNSLPKELRTFLMVSSGDELPENAILAHKGTFQKDEGNMVFHVFELIHSGSSEKKRVRKKKKEDGDDKETKPKQ